MEMASETIPLVGRHRELNRLLAMLDAAAAGRGGFAMLSGDPGIGKTRLADEIGAHAGRHGALALWARCWDEGGAPAYWLWVQIIRGCAGRLGPDAFALADPEAILGAMPILRAELGATAPAPSPRTSGDADRDRFRLFDAVAATLRSASRHAPLLIVLDDLHAADDGSLNLLRFVARHIGDGRIFILATYREEEVRLSPERQLWFSDLSRIGENFPLRPLAREEAAELIRLSSAVEPDASAVSRLYQAAEGNPFFLKEMIRLLVTEAGDRAVGASIPEGFPLPDTVRAAVRKRIALAPAPGRLALSTASVIGNEFDSSILIELLEADGAEVLRAIGQAVAAGLVESAAAPGRYRFAHPLFAQTLRQDLGEAERKQLHLRIAQILDRTGSESRPAEAAYHYCQALPFGDADKAARFAYAAAEQARRSLAFEDAARWYATALSACEAARTAAPLDRCEILLALGESQFYAQRFDAFKASFREALTIARGRGDAAQFARAVLGLGMLPPDAGASDPALARLTEEALAMLGEGDASLRVRLLNQLAERLGALGWTGDSRSSELTADAVKVGRRCGDPEILAEALYGRYFALRGPDGLEERLSISAEIASLVERHQMAGWEFRTGYYRGADLLEAGDAEGAWRELTQLQRAGDLIRIGHPGVVEATEAMRALLDRSPDEAERLIERARSAGLVRPNAVARQIHAMQIFAARREQGRADELADSLRRAISRVPTLLFSRCALALACADADRRDEAIEHFDWIAASDFTAARRDYTWTLSIAMLAEVCFVLGDEERAARIRPRLAPYQGRNAAIGALLCLGSIARYLAMLDSVLGRHDEAEQMFEQALAADRRLGAPVLLARGNLQRAICRARTGDRAGALTALNPALALADNLGLTQVASKARALEEKLGSPKPAPRDESAGADEPNLFQLEGEFWTIRFQGGPAFRIRDAKGLGYLAALIRSPSAEIHVLDLAAAGETVPDSGDGGEMLDVQARLAYRRRLAELHEELEEAKARDQVERATKIEDEIEVLTREISRAVGLGGRQRRAASVSERARLNVTRAIKAAIERISEKDPALGLHFSEAIRTGTYCCYMTRAPIVWHS